MTEEYEDPEMTEKELAEEAKDEAKQRLRDEFKLQITQNLSEKLYADLDKEITPYLHLLEYYDMVDIMVGIIHATSHLQLKQVAKMKQEDLFYFMKQRWILTTLEMLKSFKKVRYDEHKDGVDPAMDRQIEEFEEHEKNLKEDEFRERKENDIMCWTKGCMNTVDDGSDHCASCLKSKAK